MHLSLEQIHKTFPGVKALQGVDLEILPGEIHALCGENGAGKSTLMNILAGNVPADGGKITINGEALVIGSPRESFQIGIATVHQHLSLTDTLSVAENIYANTQPVNRWGLIQYGELFRQTRLLLEQLGLDHIDPRRLAGTLSAAERQMIEIAKALSKHPSVLILDEPTASLTERETTILFSILKNLKQHNISIIYISHRLDEIFLLADRITVLKDGQSQGTFPKEHLSKEELIRKMVGRDVEKVKTSVSRKKEVALSVQSLTGKGFTNITFKLNKGEILGLSGLVGAGRTEIARAIFGADKIISGTINADDRVLDGTHPADAIHHRIAYVPEERKKLGLFQEMTIEENIIVAASKKVAMRGFFDAAKSTNFAKAMTEKLRIAAPDVKTKAGRLSGGNQQKVLLAKWLLTDPDILIVDEPTHGIDVGARFEIYTILQSLAASGKSILMISSDLPELLSICDRIIVIKEGAVAGEFQAAEATEEKIMALATN
jgi:ABC-type sugar transport system ATPase subunit